MTLGSRETCDHCGGPARFTTVNGVWKHPCKKCKQEDLVVAFEVVAALIGVATCRPLISFYPSLFTATIPGHRQRVRLGYYELVYGPEKAAERLKRYRDRWPSDLDYYESHVDVKTRRAYALELDTPL